MGAANPLTFDVKHPMGWSIIGKHYQEAKTELLTYWNIYNQCPKQRVTWRSEYVLTYWDTLVESLQKNLKERTYWIFVAILFWAMQQMIIMNNWCKKWNNHCNKNFLQHTHNYKLQNLRIVATQKKAKLNVWQTIWKSKRIHTERLLILIIIPVRLSSFYLCWSSKYREGDNESQVNAPIFFSIHNRLQNLIYVQSDN